MRRKTLIARIRGITCLLLFWREAEAEGAVAVIANYTALNAVTMIKPDFVCRLRVGASSALSRHCSIASVLDPATSLQARPDPTHSSCSDATLYQLTGHDRSVEFNCQDQGHVDFIQTRDVARFLTTARAVTSGC